MLYFNKFFKIPGPKALGMSDTDYAMPSEFFRNNSTEATWEDYYSKIKKEYPIRYFLSSTIPNFFQDMYVNITAPIRESLWFVKYHLIPKYRYHWLDLRQPKNVMDTNSYRYGWRDTDSRMVYAMMNLLVQFVEEEMPEGYYVPSDEEAANDPGLKIQRENYLEFMEIYKFWKEDQFLLDNARKVAQTAWYNKHKASKGDKSPELESLRLQLEQAEKICDITLDMMLHRLINIRHCLWT